MPLLDPSQWNLSSLFGDNSSNGSATSTNQSKGTGKPKKPFSEYLAMALSGIQSVTALIVALKGQGVPVPSGMSEQQSLAWLEKQAADEKAAQAKAEQDKLIKYAGFGLVGLVFLMIFLAPKKP